MISNIDCVLCLIRRQARRAAELPDDEQGMAYLCDALRVIAEHAPGVPAPVIVNRLKAVESQYFGTSDLYREEKIKYNEMLLALEDSIRERIDRTDDRLRTAMLFARAGNYIDFGAMHSVDDDALARILGNAEREELDEELYAAFLSDLAGAKRLLYLTDNCGEIVLDKLFIERIHAAYPELSITAMVKGAPVLNDADVADAATVGLDSVARVIGNGCSVAGTWLPEISDEARAVFDEADVIIAKGQANFETLCGCGANIYYLLLCKCDRFTEMLGMKKLTGVFLNERRATRS